MGVLSWIIVGFLVGIVSQWLVKGPRTLGCTGTVILGIVGSLVGGTIWNALTGSGFELQPGGFLASVFGGVTVLVMARLFNPRAPRP